VHGGRRDRAALVDDDLVAELAALSDLAPLHQPPALEALDRCRRRWPSVPQIACFDTAFHTTIPDAARTYALPPELRSRVPAVGFHGLSYAWAAGRLGVLAPGARRAIVAHLGGGQSLCALSDGRSMATTMGFSTLDGLVMATRCGSVDPGAVLWLAGHAGDDLADTLERRSGLLGLCGDGDMRVVRRRAAAGDADARAALDVWRHAAVGHLGAFVAHLGGIDALAFTGGVGENDAEARAELAEALAYAGVGIVDDDDGDGGAGAAPGEVELTAPGARVRTFVIPSREELQLVAEGRALLDGAMTV
jgi:acetate kinase